MGLSAYVYDSPLGNSSNNGLSKNFKEVCIVNVDGPFDPKPDLPAVKLVKRKYGNVVAIPVGLEEWQVMFGGAFVATCDSRFSRAVQELSGYDFGFPVALHDRVE